MTMTAELRLCCAAAVLSAVASAQGGLPAAKPVPRMQAVPVPGREISFQREGKEIARFHYGAALDRPFVFPVIGPSGRMLTRMGHPGDPDGHSHHNSVWFSFGGVNGVEFWSDKGAGKIVVRRVEELGDADDRAFVVTTADWKDTKTGKVLLTERRTTIAHALPGNEWVLLLDLELKAAAGDVTIAKDQFGPIGVRVAKTMGVAHGGGRIRSSEGAEGEKAIFRKPARWVDYSGLSAPGIVEGLTLMDHPSNPRHPQPFHVREDGWMGIFLTLGEALTIRTGTPLRLRYGVYVHAGLPAREALDARWRAFSSR
jgi:hypothetical protein